MSDALIISEIFKSVQGESTWAGLPCVFVRLAGCDLRCSYCDTTYAFSGGDRMTLEAVLDRVSQYNCRLVELTGGEPLLQSAALPLMARLAELGYTVLLETSGAHDIGAVDSRVIRIMDLKCPGSGECDRNRWENIPLLRSTDEVKFVIVTREDYEWAREQIGRWSLPKLCTVLLSWAAPASQSEKLLKSPPPGQHPISMRELVERMLADQLPVRFQLQLHKYIWDPSARGV